MEGICTLFELCNPQMLSDYTLSRNQQFYSSVSEIMIDNRIDSCIDLCLELASCVMRQLVVWVI